MDEDPKPKEESLFEFVTLLTVLVLIGGGEWFALRFVRHEREAGSVTHQLHIIDEEAKKGGWTRDSNGDWSLLEVAGTNTSRSQ